MKRLALALAFLIALSLNAYAQDSSTWKFSTPMQTGITGFWFPGDNTIAVGTFITALRIEESSFPLWSIDVDGTIAKEINESKDTLAGIGLKINYNVTYTDETGVVFIPSIGFTVMNNIKSFDTLLTGFKGAVYGSVVLYKF